MYPGTFDPITKGHMDIVTRVLHIFDEIIIVVAENPRKKTLFSVKERIEFIRDCFHGNHRVKVMSHQGLIVDFMKKMGIGVIIRGLRAVSDFEFEFQMALTNRKLNSHIETVFLMPDEKYTYLNSTVVKEVAQFGGALSSFVTPMVSAALKKKLQE